MTRNFDTATSLVERMKVGEFSATDLVQDCLDQIAASEPAVKAWAHLDADNALAQASALDELRELGKPLGPLHGVPVGIKDIYDTADMPTEYNSQVHAGRQPDTDCTAIAKLREAGAVIMGKTVTAEFAFKTPGETTNPHNPVHTPGGSSSGSAAAVAAGHVPLAVGSQTGGSIIRPASFCGTFGFKPSRGMISRRGVLQTSETFDQLGGFARSLEDISLLTDALTGYDIGDTATYTRAKQDMSAGCLEEVPVEPRFAWFDLPFADRLPQDAREGFSELIDALEGRIQRIDAPEHLGEIIEHHRIIHHFEVRRNLADQFENHADQISPALVELLTAANGISEDQYAVALGAVDAANTYFNEFFEEFDAVVTPSSAGQAPKSLESTGDPIFCAIWTFAGLPALSLPLMTGDVGLPIGVQLVGNLEEDARLCRTANWLLQYLSENL